MPAGKTHDKITWFSSLPVLGLAWLCTQRLGVSLILALSFLFSGLMFSGDLDVKSVQYKRWGWFRWIWVPYQKWVPHRSPLSHGPVLGTLTRLVYLTVWLLLLFGLFTQSAGWLAQQELAAQSQTLMFQLTRRLQGHPKFLLAALAGLWLGALSHTWADELGSRWKKMRNKRSSQRSKRRPRKGKKRN